MSGRWWRAYDDALHDPKLQRLPPHLFKTWFNLMCIASKHDGVLPAASDLAFMLRKGVDEVRRDVAELVARRLVDHVDGIFRPHNWEARQYRSDLSSQRVRDHRKRSRNVSCNVPETEVKQPQIQSTETETETERKKIPADAVSSPTKYYFEAGVIRLTEKDFKTWEESFPALSMKAELTSLAEWASGQPKWFFAVAGALAKRNRDELRRRAAAASPAVYVGPGGVTPNGQPWPEGII